MPQCIIRDPPFLHSFSYRCSSAIVPFLSGQVFFCSLGSVKNPCCAFIVWKRHSRFLLNISTALYILSARSTVTIWGNLLHSQITYMQTKLCYTMPSLLSGVLSVLVLYDLYKLNTFGRCIKHVPLYITEKLNRASSICPQPLHLTAHIILWNLPSTYLCHTKQVIATHCIRGLQHAAFLGRKSPWVRWSHVQS